MKKILILEKSKNLKTLYRAVLGDAGYQVSFANSLKTVLKKAEDESPDLLIMDNAPFSKTSIKRVLGKMILLCTPTIVHSSHPFSISEVQSNPWKKVVCVDKSSDFTELIKKIDKILKFPQ